MPVESIDICCAFDVTGSMQTCIGQVRRNVEQTVKYLFDEIPNIRVSIVAIGDYCDGANVINILDFEDNKEKIISFIKKVNGTYGGDEDEAYELALNRVRTLSWKSKNNKALVIIGDASPHKVGYKYDKIVNKLDWKNEAELLHQAGVNIYPVQCLDYARNSPFYDGLARISGTPKLELSQFSDITNLLLALCFKRAGKLEQFEEKINKFGNVSYKTTEVISVLSGRKAVARKKSVHSLHSVSPARFQVLEVDRDISIKDFVEENGLLFNVGRGFYEFTKTVKVQKYKEIILQDTSTEDLFAGDKARELAGLPVGTDAKVKPSSSAYKVFIQSTSNNRKLLKGTKFLYEVDSTR